MNQFLSVKERKEEFVAKRGDLNKFINGTAAHIIATKPIGAPKLEIAIKAIDRWGLVEKLEEAKADVVDFVAGPGQVLTFRNDLDEYIAAIKENVELLRNKVEAETAAPPSAEESRRRPRDDSSGDKEGFNLLSKKRANGDTQNRRRL